MSDTPRLSVISAWYNRPHEIEASLSSVLDQEGVDFEYIVVDDASTDVTFDKVTAIARTDPRVKPMRMAENVGTYLAKNRGIRAAGGAFVALCDADDRWSPDHLSRHLQGMARNPSAMVSTSHWLRVFDDGRIDIKAAGGIAEPCPHSTFFRRDVFDRVGLFDSVRLGADREILGRVGLEYGPKALLRMPDILTLGRRHAASLTTSGAGAVRGGRTAALRHEYWRIWNEWHLSCVRAGRPLFNSGRPEDRPYAVPRDLV